MKTLASLLIISCVIGTILAGAAIKERIIPDYLREPLRDLHKDCVASSGVNEEHLKVCLDKHVPDIQEVKCYIDCLIRSTHLYSPDGGVDLRKVRYMVPSDVFAILEHLQDQCGHIVKEDGCETAYHLAKCYFENHEATLEFCHLLVFDYNV